MMKQDGYSEEQDRLHALYVATDGCDGWSGKAAAPDGTGRDGPLATLAGARDRIRALRRAGKLNGPTEVRILAGVYPQTATLRFEEADLGTAETPVVYGKHGPGEVRIAGGAVLGPAASRDGAIVRWGPMEPVEQLFYRGKRMPKARYPRPEPDDPYGSGWLYADGTPVSIYEHGHGAKDRFVCRDPRLAEWARIGEAELFVFPRYNWTNQILRVESYDAATGTVKLREPSLYEIYPGDRFYFQGVGEELTAPGYWHYDIPTRTLLFYPPEPFADDDRPVIVSAVDNLIELTGQPDVPPDLKAEKIDWRDSGGLLEQKRDSLAADRGYIAFRGLTLEGCGTSAVLMRNVKACRVGGCTIRNTGGTGIVALGGSECAVTDSDIYETGSHGVYLSGGARSPFDGTFRPGGHEASNNYIHHIGVCNKSVAGVALQGVGHRAAHNLIHDGPRWGILSRGNDHLIEYNHIRHVNIETSDTSAIYLVDRDWSMRGTKIRFNRIHDVLGYHRTDDGVWLSPSYAFGIYLDDWTSGVEVYGNVAYRMPRGGIYIHAGQDNVVENNLFLDSRDEMGQFRRWEPAKEYLYLGTHGLGFRRNRVRGNIFASASASAALYGLDNLLDEDGVPDIAGNVWENNLVWLAGGRAPEVRVSSRQQGKREELWPFAEWQRRGFDAGSQVADPRFADPGNDDFRLLPDSPALQAGFAPLPFERMGPQASPDRASWPIAEAAGVREFPPKSGKTQPAPEPQSQSG